MDCLITGLNAKETVIEELRKAGRAHASLFRDSCNKCLFFLFCFKKVKIKLVG